MTKISYPYLYPGDHLDKRAARLFLYKHALESPRNGYAITLAGPTPGSELHLLKNYLRWPADRVMFIDHSEDPRIVTALHDIKRDWPEAKVYLGDLQNLLVESRPIGFANLDFMGHLNHHNVIPCLKLVVPQLLKGAVLGLTWERGREVRSLSRNSGARVLAAGSHYKDINDQRWAGVLSIVNDIADGALKLLGGVEYQNHHSPMAVTVFERA